MVSSYIICGWVTSRLLKNRLDLWVQKREFYFPLFSPLRVAIEIEGPEEDPKGEEIENMEKDDDLNVHIDLNDFNDLVNYLDCLPLKPIDEKDSESDMTNTKDYYCL